MGFNSAFKGLNW